MKTYKELITELSLTTLVRYRQAAMKDRRLNWKHRYDTPSEFKHHKGIKLATKKINRKMQVGRLNKTQE